MDFGLFITQCEHRAVGVECPKLECSRNDPQVRVRIFQFNITLEAVEPLEILD